MNREVRVMKNYTKFILTRKNLMFISAIVLLICLLKINYLFDKETLDDSIREVFIGPKNLYDNIFDLSIWSLQMFSLVYLVGNYIFNELSLKNLNMIFRIGSKKKWVSLLQVNILIICLVYYLIFVIGILMFNIILNKGIAIKDGIFIMQIYFILVLTGYFVCSLYTMLVLLLKNHSVVFLVIVIMLYLSIVLGDSLGIDKFLPMNHGIIIKRSLNNINFQFSMIFICILSVINALVIRVSVIKSDLICKLGVNS